MGIERFKLRKRNRTSGIAVVEFLFAAPAFFILVFFVVEIALVWNDRHMMRLAAYRAARSVVKYRVDKPPGGSLCWTVPQAGQPEDAVSKDVHTRARRAASKVMATVTPSVTQLLTMFHFGTGPNGNPAGKAFDDAITSLTESQVGSAAETVTTNPYVHAIVRQMKGLPAAWLMTDLRCQDVVYDQTSQTKRSKGVEMTLVYHRPAKMPYIGSLMWMLHKLQEFAQFGGTTDDGTGGPFRINPLNYGIEFDTSLSSPQIIAAANRVRQIITDKAAELGSEATDAVNQGTADFPIPLPTIGAELPQIFGDIAGKTFDTAAGNIAGLIPASAVNWIADQALQLFLMVPEEVKTIPVTVSVRIPDFNQAYVNAEQPWKGSAMMVGAFGDDSKIAQLSRELSKIMDNMDPPNSNGGLPYAKD